jgi:hypothetical protein
VNVDRRSPGSGLGWAGLSQSQLIATPTMDGIRIPSEPVNSRRNRKLSSTLEAPEPEEADKPEPMDSEGNSGLTQGPEESDEPPYIGQLKKTGRRGGHLSVFRALASNKRVYSIPETKRRPLDLVQTILRSTREGKGLGSQG